MMNSTRYLEDSVLRGDHRRELEIEPRAPGLQDPGTGETKQGTKTIEGGGAKGPSHS